MTYHYSRTVALPFDQAIAAVTASLARQGFGVLSDIDVTATLRKKLDIGFRPYRILGACNPRFAHQALEAEDKIGTMLPCNVVVQQQADGTVEISAIDPASSMQAVQNPKLTAIAEQVRDLLRTAVDEVGRV